MQPRTATSTSTSQAQRRELFVVLLLTILDSPLHTDHLTCRHAVHTLPGCQHAAHAVRPFFHAPLPSGANAPHAACERLQVHPKETLRTCMSAPTDWQNCCIIANYSNRRRSSPVRLHYYLDFPHKPTDSPYSTHYLPAPANPQEDSPRVDSSRCCPGCRYFRRRIQHGSQDYHRQDIAPDQTRQAGRALERRTAGKKCGGLCSVQISEA